MESLIGVVEPRPVAEESVDAFVTVTSERISETSVSDRGFTAVGREKDTVPEEPADPSPVRGCLFTLAVGLTLIWGAAEAIPMERRRRAARSRDGARTSRNPLKAKSASPRSGE